MIYCVFLSAKGKHKDMNLSSEIQIQFTVTSSSPTLSWADYLTGFTNRGQSLSHKYIHFRGCMPIHQHDDVPPKSDQHRGTWTFVKNHYSVYKPSCGTDKNWLFRDYKWVFIKSLIIWRERLGFPFDLKG